MKGNRSKSRLKQLCDARANKEGKDSVSAENAGNKGSDDVIVSASDSDQNQGSVPMSASKHVGIHYHRCAGGWYEQT